MLVFSWDLLAVFLHAHCSLCGISPNFTHPNISFNNLCSWCSPCVHVFMTLFSFVWPCLLFWKKEEEVWRDAVLQSTAPVCYCISAEAIAAVNGSRLKKSHASCSSLSNRCCLATGLYYARHMWCIRRKFGTLVARFAIVCVLSDHWNTMVCVCVCSYTKELESPQLRLNVMPVYGLWGGERQEQ